VSSKVAVAIIFTDDLGAVLFYLMTGGLAAFRFESTDGGPNLVWDIIIEGPPADILKVPEDLMFIYWFDPPAIVI